MERVIRGGKCKLLSGLFLDSLTLLRARTTFWGVILIRLTLKMAGLT